MPEGCREGPDDVGRETGAGGPFAAISQLGWSGQSWGFVMFVLQTSPVRGAQGMEHNSLLVPQHRVLPPAAAIWSKSLIWDSSRGQGAAGEMILFYLRREHQESVYKLALQQQHL